MYAAGGRGPAGTAFEQPPGTPSQAKDTLPTDRTHQNVCINMKNYE